jgi:hypothetical protein
MLTYACPAWEFAAESHLLKLQRLQNKVLPAPLVTYRGTFRLAIYTWHLNFQIYMISFRNYAGSKQ